MSYSLPQHKSTKNYEDYWLVRFVILIILLGFSVTSNKFIDHSYTYQMYRWPINPCLNLVCFFICRLTSHVQNAFVLNLS